MKDSPQSREGGEGEAEKRSNSGYIDAFSRFVDHNKRIITYGLYGVCGVGGILVVRSLRVFGQFKNIKEIPAEFIDNNHSLFGHVEKSEVVLKKCNMVPRISLTHIPIYGKHRRTENCQIPLVISGIRVHPGLALLAGKTLTEIAENKKVKVTIFGLSGDELEGKVCMKKFGIFWRNCLGENLVRQGYAEIVQSDLDAYPQNREVVKYRRRLENSQALAKKKKSGLWKFETDEEEKSSFMKKIISFVKLK